ncbi:hypothetical protein JW926_13830 [Candidatus Sumerlaeota bacterium]|nr:hypothetical protein [Candidatus Sumerlaeota bacterium]
MTSNPKDNAREEPKDATKTGIKKLRACSASFFSFYYPVLLSCLLVFLVGFFLEYKKMPVFTTVPEKKKITTYDLNRGASDFGKTLKEFSGDWILNQYGFGLKTGGRGRMGFRINKAPGESIFLTLWILCIDPFENRIIVESPLGKAIYSNYSSEGRDSLDLSVIGGNQSWVDVFIEYRDLSGLSNPNITLIDQVSFCVMDYPYTRLPRFHEIFGCMVLAVILFGICVYEGMKPLRSGMVSLLSCIVMTIQLRYWGDYRTIILYSGLVLLIHVGLVIKKTRTIRGIWQEPWIIFEIMLYITLAGFIFRWNAMGRILFKDVVPDVKGFQSLARNLKTLYGAGMREPLYVWMLRMVLWFLPLYDINVRMVSFAGSITMIPLIFYTGKKMEGPLTGILAAIFPAFSETLIVNSAEGLREEWICVLLILTALALIVPKKPIRLYHGVLSGIVLSLSCLMRLTLLYPLILISLIVVVINRWRAAPVLLMYLFFLSPLLPHLRHNYKQEGLKDPFYSINIHARYYRNLEFAGRPGFITHEQFRRQAYSGSPVTAFQYIFRMHDFKTVVAWSWEGFKRIFFTFYMEGRLAPFWMFRYLFWIGVVLLLLKPWGRWIDLFLILSVGSVLFLCGRPAPLYLDYRLVLHVIPFMALAIGAAPVIAFEEGRNAISYLRKKTGSRRIVKKRKRILQRKNKSRQEARDE